MLEIFKTDDGIELVINNQTGEAYATQAGYARMSGIGKDTVSRRLSRGYKGVDKSQIKYTEIQTSGGVQGVALIPADLVFDWSIKDNPGLAKAMGTAGATLYLQRLAGYEASVHPEPQTPKTFIEALEALLASEKEKVMLAAENQQLREEVTELSTQVDELFEYSSIVRVAKFNNVSEKRFDWRKLKAASTVKELEIKQVPCPRFGTKNLYSHDAWRYCYPDAALPETNTFRLPEGDQ